MRYEEFSASNIDARLDRASGIYTMKMRWPPEKGARQGERITQETLDRLKFVEVSGTPVEPMPEYAVEIALPD